MKPRTRFLIGMAMLHDWRLGAEIGVAAGENLVGLLENCPELTMYGVDVWVPISSDTLAWDHRKNEFYCRSGCERFKKRAVLIKEHSWAASFKVADNSLDFVFIDGDHSTRAVELDIEFWTPKVKAGGYILGHDLDMGTVRKAVKNMAPASGYKTGGDCVWYWKKD